MPYKKNIIWIN